MEYLIFAAVMLGFIVLFMVKGFLDYRKSQREFIRKLRSDYGVLPQKEYKPEQFANISHYFLKHREGFVIDDITWNDLNMDDVFKRMNYTWSAAGEEYLYYIMRKPARIIPMRELLFSTSTAGWGEQESFLFMTIWIIWMIWGSGAISPII